MLNLGEFILQLDSAEPHMVLETVVFLVHNFAKRDQF